MGRITVFTSQDICSKQVKKALESRGLPYEEICLSERPSRINDLRALELGPMVPQVFFNNRAVGGLEKCLKELKRWDKSSRFDTPLKKYEAEIASVDNPDDSRLARGDVGEKFIDAPPAPIQPHIVVKLPSGKIVPLREATQLMKDACPPMEEHKYKGVVQKNCFSGRELKDALKDLLDINELMAKRFIERLLQASVLHHVDRKRFPDEAAEFQDTTKDFYRLQCYETPDILNSYRLWPNNRRDCVAVAEDLMKRLSTVEMESLDGDGLINYHLAWDSPSYAVFEDAVCELQKFSLDDIAQLDPDTLTAFCLNVYWVMLRYAYLKVGIPLNEEDRRHFMDNVKFYLGDDYTTFTLDDWVDVLRGKSKHKYLKGVRKNDSARILMALFMGPHNGSFWSSPYSRFTVQNLNEELEVAAFVYCHEEKNVMRTKEGKIRLSSLFKRYRSDFGSSDKDILTVIRAFSNPKIKEVLDQMLASKEKVQISYHEPQLGFHSTSGPWYNQKGVEVLRKNFGKSKSDALGGSSHSVTSKSSNHSSYAWH